MSILVKICGLTSSEAVDAAIEAGADIAGFVFFAPSPRNVSVKQAERLFARALGKVAISAVLVDPEPALLDSVCGLRPDVLQFHGAETPERLAAVRRAVAPIAVVKGIGVASAADLDRARAYAGAVDRLLLDAKAEPGAVLPGGNGLPFDWRLIAGAELGAPFMLSGGLTADNVGDAVRLIGATPGFLGVDVSSGVERAPGDKDPRKVRDFVEAVRAADREAVRPGQAAPGV
jgi:phosphoribosylanthranilate isomerase